MSPVLARQQPVQPVYPMHMQPMPPQYQPAVPVVMPNMGPCRWDQMPQTWMPSQTQQGSDVVDLDEELPAPPPPPADPERAPEPLGLRHNQSVSQPRIHRVHWTQHPKFLNSSDKTVVSPAFQIYGATWKLVLTGEVPGKSEPKKFKESQGNLGMKLKCEQIHEGTEALTLMFYFFVGDEKHGPATHDFMAGKALAGLTKRNVTWDAKKQVKNNQVTVGVEFWAM
jgi:hypothetical protein